MGLISMLKGAINRMLGRQEVTKPFGVEPDVNSAMQTALIEWDKLFTESTTNIASIIASEAARLATIDMDITLTGSSRAESIQDIININRDRLRSKLELGCAYGGMILKPSIGGIDFIPATRYIPTSFDSNGNIDGVIFIDQFTKSNKYYTRLEYHRFEFLNNERVYIITNKAFKSDNKATLGYEIPLSKIERWSNLVPDVQVTGIDKPLFGYFRMPNANNVDIDSPLGVSIFSKAVESIKDFDMWYAKWKREGKLSDKYLFVDEQAMMKPGATGANKAVVNNPMPELIKGLRFGNNANKCIEEFNPEIRVEDFKLALQTQLDIISVQCGFSSGYFSFDSKSGVVTATQIQSEDQRTNSTCTDIQQNYKLALEGLLYAIQVMHDLYDTTPSGKVDISFYLRDLYVNADEDRKRAFELAEKKYIPKWKYLVDYEGYSEEEAKKLVEEAEGVKTDNNMNNMEDVHSEEEDKELEEDKKLEEEDAEDIKKVDK